MLTNETRRNILDRVKASGYPGGVSEAFRAAEQGVDVVDQFVKQQQQEQQQQQEMQASQQQMQGNEGMSQRESSPPLPPMNRPDGRISPPNVNQPIDNNQGHLVQSENTQNVGIQSLPTGSAQGQVIQAKNGGVRKYNHGGTHDNSNEELENAYEQYALDKEMEDNFRSEEGGSNHSSSIAYNHFKKIASTQGIDVASQYSSKENGKVTSEVNEDYFNREAMKNQSLGTVRSWSPANQKAYYEKLASKNSMMSASDFRSLDDEKLKAQNTTPTSLDAINSEYLHTEKEKSGLLNLNLQRGKEGSKIVTDATNKAAPYVLAGLGATVAAPYAIGGLFAGTGGGLIGAGTRQLSKPILRYGTKATNAFKNMATPFGQGTSNIYRGRQFFSGLYNSAKVAAVPKIYNTSAKQLGTEISGKGNYQNRLNTAAKLTDVIPALSYGKEAIKVGSDIGNKDYISAGVRGVTQFIPGFKKSKQFSTGVKHHALKLANSYINTEPSNIQNYQTQFRDGGVRYSRRRMGYVSRNIL